MTTSSLTLGGVLNLTQGGNIASAATTDIGAATGNFVIVTGTVTITALGTAQAGAERFVQFDNVLILTYNATSLILPNAANITTAVGDQASFISLGSGNWSCLRYYRKSGVPLRMTSQQLLTQLASASIASATTTDLSTATGDSVDITGTTTITAFGTLPAGTTMKLRFTGAGLTLTHNATSLRLLGQANILTETNDIGVFVSLGSGNWQMVSWGRDLPGKRVIQIVSTITGAVATGTTAIPIDDTIPQITEGDQYMTLAITPRTTTSTLVIQVTANINNTNAQTNTVALFQDSTANALAAQAVTTGTASEKVPSSFVYTMTSGTTSSTTFRVRAGGPTGATTTFNGSASARLLGGVFTSSIIITEYAAY